MFENLHEKTRRLKLRWRRFRSSSHGAGGQTLKLQPPEALLPPERASNTSTPRGKDLATAPPTCSAPVDASPQKESGAKTQDVNPEPQKIADRDPTPVLVLRSEEEERRDTTGAKETNPVPQQDAIQPNVVVRPPPDEDEITTGSSSRGKGHDSNQSDAFRVQDARPAEKEERPPPHIPSLKTVNDSVQPDANSATGEVTNSAVVLEEFATLDEVVADYLTTVGSTNDKAIRAREMLQKTSLEDVTGYVRTLQGEFAHRSSCKKLLDRLEPGMKNLERFSQVIETFCSSHPEVSMLVWGGLKLLLQLAREFLEFFEKLLLSLEKITNALPNYDIFLQRFPNDRTLRKHIVSSCIDVLEFMREATLVFVRPSSETRSSTSVGWRIFWTPFDSRFNNIISRFDVNKAYIEQRLLALECLEQLREDQKAANDKKASGDLEAVRLLNRSYAQASSKHRRAENQAQIILEKTLPKYSESIKDVEDGMDIGELRSQVEMAKELHVRRIRRWLQPIDNKDILHKISHTSDNEAGNIIVGRSEYLNWFSKASSSDSSSSSRLLWIKGKPGSGKTFLTYWIKHHIEGTPVDGTHYYTTCVFHCVWSDPHRNTLRSLLSSILGQILQSHEARGDIHNAFSMAALYSPEDHAISTEQLWELLDIVLALTERLVIMLDGLDELDLEDCKDTAIRFSQLSKKHTTLRVIILARNNSPGIPTSLVGHPWLNLHDLNMPCIETYILGRISEVFDAGLVNTFAATKEDVSHELARKANGVFMWARLALNSLSSKSLSPIERTELLEDGHSLGRDLNGLYDRILSHDIGQSEYHDRKLAIEVLSGIVVAQRKMHHKELNIAISVGRRPGVKSPADPDGLFLYFAEHVAEVCCNLIEIDNAGYMDFIHFSVIEYLSDPKSGVLEPAIVHAQFGISCLNYLLFQVPPKPLAGKISIRRETHLVEQDYPFLEYAATYWPAHILCARRLSSYKLMGAIYTEEDILVSMSCLFHSRGSSLAWIEALYRFQASNKAREYFLALLESFPHGEHVNHRWQELCSRMETLTRDLELFQESFGKMLGSEDTVQELWTGMTDFLDGTSHLNENPGSVTTFNPTEPIDIGDSPEARQVETIFSLDQDTMALITIWKSDKEVIAVDFFTLSTGQKSSTFFQIDLSHSEYWKRHRIISMSPDLSKLFVNTRGWILRKGTTQCPLRISNRDVPRQDVAFSSDGNYLAHMSYQLGVHDHDKEQHISLVVYDLTVDKMRLVWEYKKDTGWKTTVEREPLEGVDAGYLWERTSIIFSPGTHLLHVSVFLHDEKHCFVKDVDDLGTPVPMHIRENPPLIHADDLSCQSLSSIPASDIPNSHREILKALFGPNEHALAKSPKDTRMRRPDPIIPESTNEESGSGITKWSQQPPSIISMRQRDPAFDTPTELLQLGLAQSGTKIVPVCKNRDKAVTLPDESQVMAVRWTGDSDSSSSQSNSVTRATEAVLVLKTQADAQSSTQTLVRMYRKSLKDLPPVFVPGATYNGSPWIQSMAQRALIEGVREEWGKEEDKRDDQPRKRAWILHDDRQEGNEGEDGEAREEEEVEEGHHPNHPEFPVTARSRRVRFVEDIDVEETLPSDLLACAGSIRTPAGVSPVTLSARELRAQVPFHRRLISVSDDESEDDVSGVANESDSSDLSCGPTYVSRKAE